MTWQLVLAVFFAGEKSTASVHLPTLTMFTTKLSFNSEDFKRTRLFTFESINLTTKTAQTSANSISRPLPDMVSEMVQNSQSLYSFTFNAVIVIHEYIYSHSTTKFTFKNYIYSHLRVYFLFTIIFTHINEMFSSTFNALYSFTFTIEIFIQHFLRTTSAHH